MPARIIAALVVLAAAVTGCSSEKFRAGPATPTARPATSSAPAPAPSSSPAALTFGMPVRAATTDVEAFVTALAYRQPLRSTRHPERPGYEYAGAEVKTCLRRSAAGMATVAWSSWTIRFADSTAATPAESWSADAFSVPLYPASPRTIRPGVCVRGWVVYEVPRGKRAVSVTYAAPSPDSPIPPIDWTVQAGGIARPTLRPSP
ncbi:hypothetical protein AB0L06_29560 [Spirillospora sp. NPDC052269]